MMVGNGFRQVFGAWLAAALLASCSWDAHAAELVRPSYVIVAFGTSLTESVQVPKELRWTSLLQDKLQHNHPGMDVVVINAGIGGSTSREQLARLEKDVLLRHPNLVIWDSGANDATFDPNLHVAVEDFAKNIKTFHDRVASQTKAKMIFWPCTPIMDAVHAYGKNPFYAAAGGPDAYEASYRKCLAETSGQLRVPFVDIDAVFRQKFKEKGWDLYLCPDGIHYREAGNCLVADSLLPGIEEIINDTEKVIGDKVQ
jgi:lysophospholipase L1-like esterase